MNKTAYPEPVPKGYAKIVVSMIHNSRFLPAGTLLSLKELAQLPDTLRKDRFLIRHNPHAQDNGDNAPQNLIYELGSHQLLDAEGRRHSRSIQRQINLEQMRIEAEEQLAQQVKEELENPNEQIRTAMQIAEDQYQAAVSKEIANQQYRVTEQQRADQVAREMIAEEDRQAAGISDSDHLVTPTIEEPAPEECQPFTSQT